MTGVSVVLAVWDGERYLAEAIESVLAQSDPPDELIVVDDGSTDGSAALAEAYGDRLRVIREPHAGAAAALNRGIEQARHELIAFIDADDVWMTHKLELQKAALAASPAATLVFGHVQQFVSEDLSSDERARLVCPSTPMPGRLLLTLLAARRTVTAVGPMDGRYRLGYFIDWHMRAEEAGHTSLMLADVVARRRLHATNTGRRDRASLGDYARVLKARLDRRRRASP
jgi:glycosyltransferase involved in cell wall biosynthesis